MSTKPGGPSALSNLLATNSTLGRAARHNQCGSWASGGLEASITARTSRADRSATALDRGGIDIPVARIAAGGGKQFHIPQARGVGEPDGRPADIRQLAHPVAAVPATSGCTASPHQGVHQAALARVGRPGHDHLRRIEQPLDELGIIHAAADSSAASLASTTPPSAGSVAQR